jgi:ABC-2 type transport system permease protein
MTPLQTTLQLTTASLKMFLRNRQAMFFTLFIPFVFITIFSLIGFDRVPQIDLGVVAVSPNAATQQFIGQLEQVSAFHVQRGSEADERNALASGERALVMLVPDALLPEPGVRPQLQTVKLLKNMGEEQQAATATTILTQMFDKTTLAQAKAPELFRLETEAINARNVRYIDFVLPGIVALSIMQVAVFSVAFVFADYKEKGILKRLIATPMRPYQFVSANVVTRLIVALVQSGLLLVLGAIVFKAHVYGNPLLVALVAALGSIMFLGLGFTISGLSKTVEAVPAIANLIVFPMMFLSGVFFPLNAMPDWLQNVVQYFPLTYFAHAMREVVAEGAGIAAIASDLWWMGAWAAVMLVLAIVTFRFEERRV